MDTTALIGSCLTKLFRACGGSGDGSTLDINYLNSVMAELLNVTCNSCQTPKTFDATDPSSYNQIWQAISRFGGRDGINAWVTGTTDLIVTDGDCAEGCNLYLANTAGDPANNQPSVSAAHWCGPFCSMASVVDSVYQNAGLNSSTCVPLDSTPAGVTTYPLDYYDDGTGCFKLGRGCEDEVLFSGLTSTSGVPLSTYTFTLSKSALAWPFFAAEVSSLGSSSGFSFICRSTQDFLDGFTSSNSSGGDNWKFELSADGLTLTVTASGSDSANNHFRSAKGVCSC